MEEDRDTDNEEETKEKHQEDGKEPKQNNIHNSIKSILIIGDTITAGTNSADYVKMLQKNLGRSITITNAGTNGDTTFSIKSRLTSTNWLTSSIRLLNPNETPPDIIILQAGTYNVICAQNEQFRGIQGMSLPPEWKNGSHVEAFSPEGFVESYKELLEICIKRAPKAHIGVLSIPPLGEDLLSELNQVVSHYNTLLKDLSSNFERKKIHYLELGETLSKMLATHYTSGDRQPPKFELGMWSVIWNRDMTTLSKFFSKKSWSQVSKENGLHLLHDHIHFNEIAGGVIVSVIEDFFKKL